MKEKANFVALLTLAPELVFTLIGHLLAEQLFLGGKRFSPKSARLVRKKDALICIERPGLFLEFLILKLILF